VLRIPPLPPAWIAGKDESLPLPAQPKSDGKMQPGGGGTEEPTRLARAESRVGNGDAGNGHGGSVTAPLPKKTVDYQLPNGTSLDDAQALLARKLEEARVIIRELEKRTGLRLTLNRNFQIVVDLSGR
jgi:hypothetical protein